MVRLERMDENMSNMTKEMRRLARSVNSEFARKLNMVVSKRVKDTKMFIDLTQHYFFSQRIVGSLRPRCHLCVQVYIYFLLTLPNTPPIYFKKKKENERIYISIRCFIWNDYAIYILYI